MAPIVLCKFNANKRQNQKITQNYFLKTLGYPVFDANIVKIFHILFIFWIKKGGEKWAQQQEHISFCCICLHHVDACWPTCLTFCCNNKLKITDLNRNVDYSSGEAVMLPVIDGGKIQLNTPRRQFIWASDCTSWCFSGTVEGGKFSFTSDTSNSLFMGQPKGLNFSLLYR